MSKLCLNCTMLIALNSEYKDDYCSLQCFRARMETEEEKSTYLELGAKQFSKPCRNETCKGVITEPVLFYENKGFCSKKCKKDEFHRSGSEDFKKGNEEVALMTELSLKFFDGVYQKKELRPSIPNKVGFKVVNFCKIPGENLYRVRFENQDQEFIEIKLTEPDFKNIMFESQELLIGRQFLVPYTGG